MDFKTKTVPFAYQQVSLQVTTVTNFDELYDALLQKGLQHEDVADERIPYWAELWPSAVALSYFLIENPTVFQHKKTIELGAGLGLPSMVASTLGAEVLCTDYISEAVAFAKKNAEQNHLQNIAFATLDWRSIYTSTKYDVILASDVAYERKMFAPLLMVYKNLLAENGTIIMSEPNRYIAVPFFEELVQNGFLIEKHAYKIETSNVSVYKITR